MPVFPRARAALVRTIAGALSIGIFAQILTDMWGASPRSVAWIVMAIAACATLRVPRGARRTAAVLGIVALWRAEDVARGLTTIVGEASGAVATGAALVLAAATAGCGSTAHDLRRAPTLHAVASTFALAIGLVLPREAVLVAVTVLVLGRRPASAPPARARATLLRGLAAAIALVAALCAWSALRAPADPSVRGLHAVLAGALVAVMTVGRPRAALGLVAVSAIGTLAALGTDGSGSGAPSILLLALPGLLAGSAIAGVSPTRAGVFAAGITGVLALGPLLERVPAASILAGTRSDHGAGPDTGALVKARADSLAEGAHIGPDGARALWRRADGSAWADIDGAPSEPLSRAGTAERFAGTLAGCLATRRTTARLVGDDWGLVTLGVRAQGFSRVDVAVADVRFARAVARGQPSLHDAWLDPSTRLLPAPGAFLAQAGTRADALVQVVRAPWGNAAAPLPTAHALAASRRTLAEGGVHVLALSARLPAAVLDGIADAMARAYPRAALWLPPDGMDVALLAGSLSPDPRPWSAFEACTRADAAVLERVAVRSALDLASLAAADTAALRSDSDGPSLARRSDAWWLPPGVADASAAGTLTRYADVAYDPAALFGPDAPLDELAARAEARRGLLAVLDASTRGDAQGALERARSLRAAPGGERALEPLITPHLERAREALRVARREGPTSRRWDDVEAALGTARVLHPGFAPTVCLEGEAAGARGQLPRAEQAFQACVDADPGALAGWDGLARTRRSRDDVAGAEEALRGALKARPDRWTGPHNLGVLLLEVGRMQESERLLEQAASMAAREVPPPAAPLLALARLHLGTSRPALALAEAERAHAIAPSADALALRGAARLELGSLDLAEADFRAALARDARNLLARGGLGQVHATRGEHDLAAAAFRAVLEQDPRNAAARENLRRLGPLLQDPGTAGAPLGRPLAPLGSTNQRPAGAP